MRYHQNGNIPAGTGRRPYSGSAGRLPAFLLCVALGLSLTGCLGSTEGGSLTQAGLTALESGDYQTAMADFNQALQNEEDPVPALRGQGITYMGLARYEEAAEAFSAALEETDSRMPDTVRDIRLYLISALLPAIIRFIFRSTNSMRIRTRRVSAMSTCSRRFAFSRFLRRIIFISDRSSSTWRNMRMQDLHSWNRWKRSIFLR